MLCRRKTNSLFLYFACVLSASCGRIEKGQDSASENMISETELNMPLMKEKKSVVPERIHRMLTGLKNHPFDQAYQNGRPIPISGQRRQALALACKDKLGFSDVMPNSSIKLAREIEIPVEHNLYNVRLTVNKIKKETIPGKTVNGVVFSEVDRVTGVYETEELFKGPVFVRGICVGSEYIFD